MKLTTRNFHCGSEKASEEILAMKVGQQRRRLSIRLFIYLYLRIMKIFGNNFLEYV